MNKKLALRASLQRGVSLVAVLIVLGLLGIVAAVNGATRGSSADVLSEARDKAAAVEVLQHAAALQERFDLLALEGVPVADRAEPAVLFEGWQGPLFFNGNPRVPLGARATLDDGPLDGNWIPTPLSFGEDIQGGPGADVYVFASIKPSVCREVNRLSSGQAVVFAGGTPSLRDMRVHCHDGGYAGDDAGRVYVVLYTQ